MFYLETQRGHYKLSVQISLLGCPSDEIGDKINELIFI